MTMEQRTRKRNRLDGYSYDQQGTYYLTICVQDRKQVLSRILPSEQGAQVKLLPHGEVADRQLREMNCLYEGIRVDHYVIMPDHIHILLTVLKSEKNEPKNAVISKFVGTFKRFCNKTYGENIWQARSYDHIIRDQQDYETKWIYMDNNPIKWLMTENNPVGSSLPD